jgi:DinB superfamily
MEDTAMKMRSFAIVLAMLCLGAWAHAQSLSQADRDRAMKYLQDTEQGVIDATQGLSPAQWNFKPAPDRWSIAEVTEHIAATEDMLFAMVTDQVMKAPPRPAGEDIAAIDVFVMNAIPDRSHKLQAPEPLRPNNRYGSPEASLKHFEDSRAKTEEFLKKTDDLRAHAGDSPMGKKLDGYEWILFIAGHSARHTKQILEVKADPNFPKM